MAHVVFATVDSIDHIKTATWVAGDNDSYENTKRMIPARHDIRLIGRQAKDGSVQLCYASFGRGEWVTVNSWHLLLAQYFSQKLDTLPPGDSLNVFFDEMDDGRAKHAAQQLIALECGINVTKEPHGALHIAVLQVQSRLRALGIPCGDWTFVPMFKSFEVLAS